MMMAAAVSYHLAYHSRYGHLLEYRSQGHNRHISAPPDTGQSDQSIDPCMEIAENRALHDSYIKQAEDATRWTS